MKTFDTRVEAQKWLRDMQQRADRGEWGFDAKRTLTDKSQGLIEPTTPKVATPHAVHHATT